MDASGIDWIGSIQFDMFFLLDPEAWHTQVLIMHVTFCLSCLVRGGLYTSRPKLLG
jgi:hypothetical protein